MAINELLSKFKNAGVIKGQILKDSIYFNSKETIKTDLSVLNLAFSGDLDGGLIAGLTCFCGPSKCYKSLLGLYCVKAYFDKYPDAICLQYDSEFRHSGTIRGVNGN